ncbi:MAG: hypothetical protein ACPGYX_07940 [Oceanobacter sp.]
MHHLAIVRRTFTALVLLFAGILTGCIELGRHWDDEVVSLQIDYYKVQCDEDDSNLCFRFRESSDDSWEVLDDDLSGFSEFEWGNRYWINVNVSYDEDGRAEDYEFRSITSSVDYSGIDNAFSLSLYTNAGVLVANDDSNWQLGGEIDFDCGSFCTDLSSSVSEGYVVSLEFLMSDGELTLNELLCSSSEADYSSDCEGESTLRWQIAAYQTECGLVEAAMCILYRVSSSDDYERLLLEDGITNFDYVWGERGWIEVTKVVSDGGNIESVTLEEVVDDTDDRTGSGYTFNFIVRGDALSGSSSGLIDLYDDKADMNCEMYSQCSDMNDRIDDDEYMLLEAYVEDGEIVVTDVVCHDDSLDDFRDCTDDEDFLWDI